MPINLRPRFPGPVLAAALAVVALSGCAYYAEAGGRRALAIGLNYYQNTPLKYCVNDARAMGEALSASGWEADTLLAEDSASAVGRTAIVAALRAAADAAPAGGYEVFLFYFAGHGLLADGDANGTLALSGYIFNSDPERSIAPGELGTLLSTVPARRRLVILDSCFSGNFVAPGASFSLTPDDYVLGAEAGADMAWPRYLAALAGGLGDGESGLTTLAAAGAAEESQEGTADSPDGLGHGYFTAGLLGSRDAGDADRDGLVTAGEAYAHAVAFLSENYNPVHRTLAYRPRWSGGTADLVLFSARR
jgi:uncharacterized caspase-like protein